MPQVQLPIFPAGSVEINRELACRVEGEQVVYFNGHLPVFAHCIAAKPLSCNWPNAAPGSATAFGCVKSGS